MDEFTVSTLKEWGFDNLVDRFKGTYDSLYILICLNSRYNVKTKLSSFQSFNYL